MKLDKFDKLSLLSAGLLLAAALAFGVSGGGARAGITPSRMPAPQPDLDAANRLAALKTQIEAGEAKESVAALKAVEEKNPALAEPHALLGEAYSRLSDCPSAMKEYRAALQIAPDYIDKKSEKFIGKRIKAAEKEGMAQAKAELAKDPNSPSAKAELSDAYYLERMLAGGCE